MKFWQSLSGWKTKIGAGVILAAQAGKVFAPELAPWELIEQIGMWITGVGLVHTGTKALKLNI